MYYSNLQKIISKLVNQVSGPYFSAHEPAIKGSCRKDETSAVKRHVGDGREGVPFQAHVRKPRKPDNE